MDLQVIPDSWAATNLGSIVDYGKTQKCELADIDDVTWVVELEDIEKDTSRIISRGYTPARDFKSSKNIFNKGDILYGKLRPYLNKVVMADEDGVCSTEIIPINAEPSVINKYIFYWVKSHHFLDYVNDVSYGVNMPRLGTNDGLNAPFILAPFAEQKEIADRLDILLAQVEATQARLARIPDIIKHFRQSVLSAASCGFTNGDVSYKKLNVLVDILNGARRPVSASKRNDIKGNIPYYGATGVVDYLDNYTHEGRFLLVGEDGANLLSKNKDLAFIIDGKSWVNNHAHVLKAKVDVSLDFIKIVINSLDLSPWVTGSAQPKLTKRALIELPVPFFSYKEQTEIVRRVEQLFTYADNLEQQAKAAKARVDNLTQAILAKAFRGELTSDWRAANPDLISGDNSAAALLARIQAERATASGKKGKRGTSKSRTTA